MVHNKPRAIWGASFLLPTSPSGIAQFQMQHATETGDKELSSHKYAQLISSIFLLGSG